VRPILRTGLARTLSSKEPPKLLLRPPQRMAESCVLVNIIVIIMQWMNCRFSVIKGKEFVLCGSSDERILQLPLNELFNEPTVHRSVP
jgi:hypothetical protein